MPTTCNRSRRLGPAKLSVIAGIALLAVLLCVTVIAQPAAAAVEARPTFIY